MDDNQIRSYRQTLTVGLIKVVHDLFPEEQLKIPYSILDGVYCELVGSILSKRETDLIKAKLVEWVKQAHPISCEPGGDGYYHCQTDGIKVRTLYPTFDNSRTTPDFQIYYYPPGFILLFGKAAESHGFVPPAKLSATFFESQRWVENLRLDTVKDVNQVIKDNPSDLICLAEALHEKKISLIADRILRHRDNIRIILISGPSSSGKTTFAQRLSTQLRVNGLKPVALSLDNYFLNRDQTPLDAEGKYDFEALEALDLPLLDQHIKLLITGHEVETPVFDFVTGTRKPQGQVIQLHSNEILVIEGIHALNPRLLPSVDRNQLYKIYISALFQLNIDNHNRVPTTEVRLIRRLVRDDKFRGISPEKTLGQWLSVRRGENNNIFPYQEEADVMFNSSLLYELNALRPFAEPLLKSIPEDSPYHNTASRLLRLLSFFESFDSAQIPFNSILREFIGGSIYPV